MVSHGFIKTCGTNLKMEGRRWQKGAIANVLKGYTDDRRACGMLIERIVRKTNIKPEIGDEME